MDSRRKFEPNTNDNPNYGQEAVDLFLIKKKKEINKILAVRLEGLFWTGNKLGCSFRRWVWTLGFAFRSFTPIFYLTIFNPFFLTLNKVWPFNPTDS